MCVCVYIYIYTVYAHTVLADAHKHVTIVDILNRLCGHNYEYGTARYKLLTFYMYNKQSNCNKVKIRLESMNKKK